MKTWPILLAGVITATAFVGYAVVLLVANWPIGNWPIEKAALFGDSFGVLNSLFTGGAFFLILWTIVLQQAELRLQRQEMSRMVTAHRRELHMNLVSQAFGDEDLARVWRDDINDLKEFKQDAYVNFILTAWHKDYEHGLFSSQVVSKLLEEHMARSMCFKRFWKKASIEWKALSEGDELKYAEFVQLCDAAYSAAATKAGH